MTIYYVNGTSYETPSASECARGEGCLPSDMPQDLPVLDASAYVSSAAPEHSMFLMSRLFENQNIVALDFADNSQMSKTLDRISYFVERNQKRKIPSRSEIPDAGLGEGHDLKMGDIAGFYNKSAKDGIVLTPQEKTLLERLLENNLLSKNPEGNYRAVHKTALIGMSRSYDVSNRREIFIHEYSHALFFLDSEFNGEVSTAWNSLKPEDQIFLKGAMMASGVYASGDTALIQTEAQAHAIAPPFGEDGFVNILASADENCGVRGKSPPACDQFWSYRGRINDLLRTVHDRFITVSECRIPLLTDWEIERDMIFQGEAECDNITFGEEMFRRYQMPFIGNPFDPVQSALNQIQQNIDSHHTKKWSD